MKKKITAHFGMLLLVVYVSLSFANQVAILTVDKTDIENVSVIELYQNADTEPFAILDATLPKPWEVTADIISIDGALSVHAIPIDANGIKGSRSPGLIYNMLDGSDITIIITGE